MPPPPGHRWWPAGANKHQLFHDLSPKHEREHDKHQLCNFRDKSFNHKHEQEQSYQHSSYQANFHDEPVNYEYEQRKHDKHQPCNFRDQLLNLKHEQEQSHQNHQAHFHDQPVELFNFRDQSFNHEHEQHKHDKHQLHNFHDVLKVKPILVGSEVVVYRAIPSLRSEKLGTAIRSLGVNATEAEIQDMLDEFDAAGIGDINFTEFLSLVANAPLSSC